MRTLPMKGVGVHYQVESKEYGKGEIKRHPKDAWDSYGKLLVNIENSKEGEGSDG